MKIPFSFIYHTLTLNNYKIIIGNNFLNNNLINFKNSLTITNNKNLNPFNKNNLILEINDSEKNKNMKNVEKIIDIAIKNKLDRQSTFISIGGGVIGDLVGFSASIYQRGIEHIMIPTTLTAMVDSSIGGKNGINHKMAKNYIGTFYNPKIIYIDINMLKTLPEREFKSGIAEIIKYAIIKDYNFFQYLEKNINQILNRNENILLYIIKKSCEIKSEIVENDFYETNNRKILNFGHTLGHAIENYFGYGTFLHGEAISIGMIFALELSLIYNNFSINEFERIKILLQNANLPTYIDKYIYTNKMIELMQYDKKNSNGKINFVLINNIGNCTVSNNIKEDDLNICIKNISKNGLKENWYELISILKIIKKILLNDYYF